MIAPVVSGLQLLQLRERLHVGEHFLRQRPKIAALGALGNAAWLLPSSAPLSQRACLAAAFGITVMGFFLEAWWLRAHALTEAWLFRSLAATLGALTLGALLSGGLQSPVVPLLFAPVVVGFAAFGSARASRLLLFFSVAAFIVLGLAAPLGAFGALPDRALRGMLLVSGATSLCLLAVGVTGLVDAHARVAAELERFRTAALQEAEQRELSMERLGADVAHEVKNPLAAARGLVELVKQRTTGVRDQHRLEVVLTEIDRALALLRDFLGFARPLSAVQLAPCSAEELLRDVASVVEARLLEKNITLRLHAEPVEWMADQRRLRDALLNLTLNALEAVPAFGSLELGARATSRGLELSVIDNGPGIGPELRERLGRPFTSDAPGGTGLGILLAQSVARQHGGILEFDRIIPQGTLARLVLPRLLHEGDRNREGRT